MVMVCFLEYAANVALRPHRHVPMTRNTAIPIDKGTKPPCRNLSEIARRKDPLIIVRVPHRAQVARRPQPQHRRETGNIASEVISITPETASPYAAPSAELEPNVMTRAMHPA